MNGSNHERMQTVTSSSMSTMTSPNSTTNFSCCLMDPPDMVKNVMSRESITKMLRAPDGRE